jgi:hypothetical protein
VRFIELYVNPHLQVFLRGKMIICCIVGELRGSRQKVQYCITAIENG